MTKKRLKQIALKAKLRNLERFRLIGDFDGFLYVMPILKDKIKIKTTIGKSEFDLDHFISFYKIKITSNYFILETNIKDLKRRKEYAKQR
jgi:hypothetical protein